MRRTTLILAFAFVAAAGALTPAAAQTTVKHLQTDGPGGIATGVWAGDTFYLSGQLPSPVTPADRAAGKPAVYGNMQAQAESAFTKIQTALKEQGLGMGDIVMMRVYMAADPETKQLDFAGMNAAYAKFFGVPGQPNKPARSAFQVAALVTPGALLEVEVQAVKSK